jgi:hypothetical protein
VNDAGRRTAIEKGAPIADLQIDPSTPPFRIRSVALLFTTRVTSNTSNQMLAVAVGGCAVFLTIALWAWLFPALRRVDRPDEVQPNR